MGERYLILNADDFGVCHAANQAVEDLFHNGFLTSTTLMTPCPWAEDALRRAIANPKMHVGLHVTLTAEYDNFRWGPVFHDTDSLTDEFGYFYQTAKEFQIHAQKRDVENELTAQFNWMTSRGYEPDHIDNHMGTVYGLFGPSYIEPVFRLCAMHGIGFRLPQNPRTFFPDLQPELESQVQSVVETARKLRIGLPAGLYTHDGVVGPGDTYASFREYYLGKIRSCEKGVNELFVHPCVETPEIKAINSQWQKRVWEYRLMQDTDVMKTIESEGIRLVSYQDAPFWKETDIEKY